VVGASRLQIAIVLETVIATHQAVPQWIARTATRKRELLEQIAKAFCWSRQLNRNPAHGASQSGFCGCQSNVVLPKIWEEGDD